MAITPINGRERKSRYSEDETKRRILESAIGGLKEMGDCTDLIQFSYEDLVAECGVARSAAYRAFPSVAALRAAILEEVTKRDPYSHDQVVKGMEDLIGQASTGSIERTTAIGTLGCNIACTAFSSLTLATEHIVRVGSGGDELFYPDAARNLQHGQSNLLTAIAIRLSALHNPYGEAVSPDNNQPYASDLLAAARGQAAYPLTEKSSGAVFNAIADSYVQ